MSDFRYKWMRTSNACIHMGEDEESYIFKLSKHLMEHDPPKANFWRVERLDKNQFMIIGSKHFPRDD